jgi:hypothetical protein
MMCAFCRKELDPGERIGRADVCPHCGRDLRCCKQCHFYDSHAYNECREVSADRVVDKERANFCDYFLPRGAAAPRARVNRTVEAKRALEALFKK